MKKKLKFNLGLLLIVIFVFAAIYYFLFYYEIGDYSDLKFPAKMQEKPKLKPKLAVVYDDGSNVKFDGFSLPMSQTNSLYTVDAIFFVKEKSAFEFTENELAQTTDEIATVIKIACQDGRLENISTKTGKSKKRSGGGFTSGKNSSTASYASVCKVSVFDMAEKALIAEKTFTNPVYDLKAEPLNDDEKTHGASDGRYPAAKELYDFLQELKKN
jgi:hypothetical protein